MVAVNKVGGPRRSLGRGDENVEMILRERGVNALGARKPAGTLMGFDITRVRQIAPIIGLREQLLPEIRHLGGGVLVVVSDQLRESARTRAAPSLEVSVQAILELELQNHLLVGIELRRVRDFDWVDQHRALLTQ